MIPANASTRPLPQNSQALRMFRCLIAYTSSRMALVSMRADASQGYPNGAGGLRLKRVPYTLRTSSTASSPQTTAQAVFSTLSHSGDGGLCPAMSPYAGGVDPTAGGMYLAASLAA